jgi:hypothetical protein
LVVLLSSEKALKICIGRANKRGTNTTTMVDDQSFQSTSQVLHVCSNGEEVVCEKTLGNNNLQEHYKETDRERMSSRER